MHLVCISASNIKAARNRSTSLKVCHLIEEIIQADQAGRASVDIIPLVDYELKPCQGCGTCFTQGRCSSDPEFNQLYERLIYGDGFFIVSPHYAPIPARLCMLLEKIEQLAFLPRFHDETRRSPLFGRPVGIIAHGGGTEEMIDWYKGLVLDTIANALSWPVEMNILKDPKTSSNGVVFPVKRVRRTPDSIFPVQEYGWEDIRQRIEPLVKAVLGQAGNG